MYDGRKLYILYNILADKIERLYFIMVYLLWLMKETFREQLSYVLLVLYQDLFSTLYFYIRTNRPSENIFLTLGVALSNELMWNEPVNLYLCSEI